MKRGDVVLVAFPNSDLKSYRTRPALVIQDLTVGTGLSQVVLALITSNRKRSGPTRVLFLKACTDGKAMGILMDSVVVTDNIATVRQAAIIKPIGACPTMFKVDNALRQTLGL